MSTYYCNTCSQIQGYLRTTGIKSINFTGSTYQLTKFYEHTTVGATAAKIVNSVFSNATYVAYRWNNISTLLSGSTEIDNHGRVNLLWATPASNGTTFRNGVFHYHTDLVKVVFPYNQVLVHSYPIRAGRLQSQNCHYCGDSIL